MPLAEPAKAKAPEPKKKAPQAVVVSKPAVAPKAPKQPASTEAKPPAPSGVKVKAKIAAAAPAPAVVPTPKRAPRPVAKKIETPAVPEPAKAKSVKEAPKPPLTTRSTKKPVAKGRANSRITVYVARGGPARGEADYEQAFPNRHQALAFLSNQHGLTVEEQRQLAKASRLKLNRRWHGSEACALRELALDPDQAAKILRGETALV